MSIEAKHDYSSDLEKECNLASHGSVDAGDYKAHFPDIDEAKILRKIDIRVVPVLCLLYLLAFLDRVNISNAVVFGLDQDLKLEGDEFNIALVIFFVPYVLFELPSNLLVKYLKPHVWLSLSMFLFGLITLLQGFTQNLGGLIAIRFCLGLVESGIFPASFYLIAMWYKRAEAQKRYSFFFASTTLAGGFGGLLASAIGKMDGVGGYRGWRWIFILEGALTCVLSAALFFAISDFPEEVTWLSEREKDFVKARLYEDVGDSKRHDPLTFQGILQVLKDWKIVVGGFMYFGIIVPAYGYAYFAPSIIRSLGHDAIRTQLLSVPQWVCSFVVGMITATFSDMLQMRYVFILGPLAVSMAGFLILLIVHDNTHLQYGALFLASMGTYSAMPIVICWFSMNLGGHHRRAVGTAFQIGFGNIASIIAVFAFLPKDAPKYIPGYSLCIAFSVVCCISSTIYFLGVSWENRIRDQHQAKGTFSGLSEKEKKQMGDLNPDYRYLM